MIMEHEDSETTAYYTLKPHKYSVLESLELKQIADHASGFDLFLRLSSSSTAIPESLHIKFEGIRELNVGSIDRLRVRHLQIDIRSIREDQLENLNYKVIENEENVFSFLCNRFEASIIKATVN